MSALAYWIWLAQKYSLPKKKAIELIDELGSPEKVYFAREEAYDAFDLAESDRTSLLDKNLVPARGIIGRCAAEGIRIVTFHDSDYPERLRNIFDPPLVLYVRGRLPVLDEEAAVAVVGTRNCTPYGIKTAEKLGYEFALMGGLIVSGLAKGIDSAAVRGALRAGGRVLGVMGCGLDIFYPAENKNLIEDVISVGAVISEYPPGTPPSAGNFPVRNRIMSGVSLGVAVIEAPEKSGALITAARALEQGRDVFAAPGNLDAPACGGSNRLLREGAVVITSGLDLAEEYAALYPQKIRTEKLSNAVELDAKETEKLTEKELSMPKKQKKSAKKELDKPNAEEYIDVVLSSGNYSDEEKSVIRAIGTDIKHIDDVILSSGLDAPTVLGIVTMLEIDGVIIQEPGKKFKINYSK